MDGGRGEGEQGCVVMNEGYLVCGGERGEEEVIMGALVQIFRS